MKEIVHKIVCDVCGSEHEVDPDVTELLFSLTFERSGGYHYNENLEVDVASSMIRMDICSVKCLYDYAKKYYDREVEAKEERKRVENSSFFGGSALPPISGDTSETLMERLRKDGSLPPPPEVINNMINEEAFQSETGTQGANPVFQTNPYPTPSVTTTCNSGNETNGNGFNGKIENEFGYDELKRREAEEVSKKDVMDVLNAITADMEYEVEADDTPMITLSQEYYMIVKEENGDMYIGNGDRPVPLNTCIEFDTHMIVFPTFDDAVVYRDTKMVISPTTKIAKVICDPVDYHSNNGKIKYCLFEQKK